MRLKRTRGTLLTLGLMLVAAASTVAQPAISDVARRFAGEKIVYEGRMNKMKLSFSVAELTFTASEAADRDGLLIEAEAVSKGTLLSLFRFSFQQRINSSVDAREFRAARTEKHDVQKDRVRDSEAVFDYGQRRVTFIETDPSDKMRAPRRIASDISNPSYDLVSAIYFMRLQDLAVGKSFEVEVSDSGLVYKVPIVVTGRETQKSLIGKVDCWKVEPQIFGAGRLIEKDGKLIIWVTADHRRIPVGAKIKSGIGTITVKLKSYTEPRTSEAKQVNK